MMLAFLDTITDAIGLLEEVIVVALATAVQEVFAFSCVLVVVPAWEGALTRSHHWGHSTGICGGAEAAAERRSHLIGRGLSRNRSLLTSALMERQPLASHPAVTLVNSQ